MKQFAQRLLACLTVSMIVLSTPLVILHAATPTPTTDSSTAYNIKVSARLEGSPVAGLEFTLTGTSANETLKSTTNDFDQFTGLEAGDYNITILIPSDSTFELIGETGKDVTLTASDQSESVIFFLKRKDSADKSYQEVKLPTSLTKVGSETTDFTKMDPGELKGLKDFTFDNPGVNKIVYKKELDLTAITDFAVISNLENDLDLSTSGKISFDTTLYPVFNAPARLYMSGLKLTQLDGSFANIYKDGKQVEVKEMKYEAGVLSFDVDGFSTYSVVPRIKVITENLTSNSEKFDLTLQVDDLDSEITLLNNGIVVDFPTSPSQDGLLTGTLTLTNGENRIRINAKSKNGEESTQFITINYAGPVKPSNDVSNVFGITFFALLILAGLAGAGYYFLIYKRRELKQAEKQTPVIPQTATEAKDPVMKDNVNTSEESPLNTESARKDY
jgi:hypothetical protein